MTPAQILLFIKAWPQFVSFLQTAYGDFVKSQIHSAENGADKEKEELRNEITALKKAKNDLEIAASVAAINSGR